jgi:hypothetical protein
MAASFAIARRFVSPFAGATNRFPPAGDAAGDVLKLK